MYSANSSSVKTKGLNIGYAFKAGFLTSFGLGNNKSVPIHNRLAQRRNALVTPTPKQAVIQLEYKKAYMCSVTQKTYLRHICTPLYPVKLIVHDRRPIQCLCEWTQKDRQLMATNDLYVDRPMNRPLEDHEKLKFR